MAVKKSLSSLLSLSLFRLLMVQDSNDPEQAVPLSTAMLGGGSGSGGSDPDSAREATLAQVLAALQGRLTTTVTTPTTTASTVTIAANASISDGVNLTGRSLVRLTIGAAWTAADITVQTSPDGSTWYDLYDEYGAPYTIKAAASRAIYITPGPLLAVNFIRLRSGTPAAPVNQASAATVTLSSVAL